MNNFEGFATRIDHEVLNIVRGALMPGKVDKPAANSQISIEVCKASLSGICRCRIEPIETGQPVTGNH